MITLMLLVPIAFLSVIMSMFAALMAMVGVVTALFMGVFISAMSVLSTGLLGILIFIFS